MQSFPLDESGDGVYTHPVACGSMSSAMYIVFINIANVSLIQSGGVRRDEEATATPLWKVPT